MANKSLLEAVDRVKVVNIKGMSPQHGVFYGMKIVRSKKKPYPKRIQTAEKIFEIIKENSHLIGEEGKGYHVIGSEGMVCSVEKIVKLIQNNYRRRVKK